MLINYIFQIFLCRQVESQSQWLTGIKTENWCRLLRLTPALTGSSSLMAACSSWERCTARRSRTLGCTGASPATTTALPSPAMLVSKSAVSINQNIGVIMKIFCLTVSQLSLFQCLAFIHVVRHFEMLSETHKRDVKHFSY